MFLGPHTRNASGKHVVFYLRGNPLRGAGVLIEGGGQCTGSGGGRPHLKDVGGGMIRGFVLPGR